MICQLIWANLRALSIYFLPRREARQTLSTSNFVRSFEFRISHPIIHQRLTASTIQHSLDQAIQHHQAGRLREADQCYRRILQVQPNHAFAMHNLGIIAGQIGNYPVGIELLRRAIGLQPNWAEARANLGKMLTDAGQLDAAADACREAIAIRPDCAEAHNNLGAVFRLQGRLEESVAAARRAIAARPQFAEAYTSLSATLKLQNKFTEAIAAARQAIALRPGYDEAHNNLGNALQAAGQLEDAIAAYRLAIQFNPSFADAHYNLGTIFSEKDQLDEAIFHLRRAVELKPGFADAHYNLANALMARGQYDDAMDQCRSALALVPAHNEAHYTLGALHLLRGEFTKGWPEFEWRCRIRDSRLPNFSQPRWDGSALDGRTILLYADFGQGDAIQFFRYWPLVAARGGKIIIQCHGSLKRLFQISAPSCQILSQNEPLPPFDCHCPFMSLPHIFATDLSNIPTETYLRADAADIAHWQKQIANIPHPRIGLVWQGNPNYLNDRNRSIPFSHFVPLAGIPGANFISLQKGSAADAARHSPVPLIDRTDQLHDFAETAALIANLDLVISSDTAVPHLTGALGKPVWIMLPAVPDWRWLLHRSDSPWYLTMRLFRQRTRGDWPGVIENVAEQLRHFSS
jgi:tetratricopeptide (TPR) repeat protein